VIQEEAKPQDLLPQKITHLKNGTIKVSAPKKDPTAGVRSG
jgi:hypothetical protein